VFDSRLLVTSKMHLRSGKVISPFFGSENCPSLSMARNLSESPLDFSAFITHCRKMLILCDYAPKYKKRLYCLTICESLFKLDKDTLPPLSLFVSTMIEKLDALRVEYNNPPDLVRYIKKVRTCLCV
jgi:hypothetical protein